MYYVCICSAPIWNMYEFKAHDMIWHSLAVFCYLLRLIGWYSHNFQRQYLLQLVIWYVLVSCQSLVTICSNIALTSTSSLPGVKIYLFTRNLILTLIALHSCRAGSADPPVSARQGASVPIKLLHSSQSSSFAAASTLRCTSSTDRTSTSSQHLRSAGICCRWSDDKKFNSPRNGSPMKKIDRERV